EYEGKTIYTSRFPLQENDVLVAFSDGAEHAGVGNAYNFGWTRANISEFLEPLSDAGFTAKTLTTLLLDQCNQLYGGRPGDDTTVCVVRLRSRAPVHLMIGPPALASEEEKMMSLFFSKPGKHIVCGGTTSTLAARYLGKPLLPKLDFPDPEIPPTASIEGVDLVTEGVITFNRVLTYARDHLADNQLYSRWGYQKDGASLIARLLFEDATDINFYVGKAVNPAHQNPNLPIGFSIKMRLVEELADALRKMGKRIKVSYF
ncbi:MAG TPA: SpoIIE family protein phosphatase, partial [Clostridia bacterium]|nr:SpoIIE family protein phosphatase [Clostridia bacterium]